MNTICQDLRESLALVIPVWYAPDMPPQRMRELLSCTLADCELFLRPEHVALVVDGCPQAEEPAREAAEDFRRRVGEPPLVLIKEQNEGQGGAVCYGFEHYLHGTGAMYFSSRDADGDHDIYDLPQLYRMAREMEAREGTDWVYVVGQRGNLRRPMGLVFSP